MQLFHGPSANSDRIMRLKRQVQEYERGICTKTRPLVDGLFQEQIEPA